MKSSAFPALLAGLLLAGAAGAQPRPAASPAPAVAPAANQWRTPNPLDVLVIDTTKGRIIVEMNPRVAPLAVARVRDLTRAGIYNGRAFFRVIDKFMDQTGDPLDTGTGGSDKPNLPAEFVFRRDAATPMVVVAREGGTETGFIGALPVAGQTLDLALLTVDHKVNAWGLFCSGVAGMARAEPPDSGNSQFFLMRDDVHSLDQKYTAWGRVIFGMDVVRAIKTGEPPVDPDKMTTVRLLADIPVAQRPAIRVADTRGAWATAALDRARAQKVVGVTACDIDIPAEVK
ncbi:MAG TPA: peptidylprolyl isomerase [Caulobacteraceae bacterium]|nr:peptidylprolyl isomerase [Caulobacteraceae bacterium]